MDNRRRSHRHWLPPETQVGVTFRLLVAGTDRGGRLVNISLGGLTLWEDERLAALKPGDLVWLQFRLPGVPDRLVFHARLIHQQIGDGGRSYGMQFLPLAELAAEEARERVLHRFIMAEQRRQRRQRRRSRLDR